MSINQSPPYFLAGHPQGIDYAHDGNIYYAKEWDAVYIYREGLWRLYTEKNADEIKTMPNQLLGYPIIFNDDSQLPDVSNVKFGEMTEEIAARVVHDISMGRMLFKLANVIQIWDEEQFDEHMGNLAPHTTRVFDRELAEFINFYSTVGIDTIAVYLKERPDADLICDVLCIMGELKDERSYALRQGLLIQYLRHTSPRVRYGAITGLGEMNDPIVAPILEHVYEKELDGTLKNMLSQTVKYLKKKDKKHV